jgi:serine/threonine protein kinase
LKNQRAIQLVGKEVGGWSLIEYIDSGMSADVYRATKGDAVAALKLYHEWVSAEDADGTRLEREGRTLLGIRHPNLSRYFELGEVHIDAARRRFLVMEFIEGFTLTEFVAQGGPLDLSTFKAVAIALLNATSALHQAGVVHRDIKPDNIRVERGTDRVVLLDFGVVGEIERAEASEFTSQHRFLGTMRYGAPEWIYRRPPEAAYLPSVDVYSLGATFFFMLGATAPFADEHNRSAIAEAVRTRPLVVHFPDKPREIEELVRAMVAKQYAGRPAIAVAKGIVEKAEQEGRLSSDARPLDALRRRMQTDQRVLDARERDAAQAKWDVVKHRMDETIRARLAERLIDHPIAHLPGIREATAAQPALSMWINADELRKAFPDVNFDDLGSGFHFRPRFVAGQTGATISYFFAPPAERPSVLRVIGSLSDGANHADMSTARLFNGAPDGLMHEMTSSLADDILRLESFLELVNRDPNWWKTRAWRTVR